MPVATETKYPLCPEGEDLLFVLTDVEQTINPPDAQYNPGAPQWKWVFESAELMDEDDNPFKLAYYTGVVYGNEKAKLTKLLDRIAKRLTVEERKVFDTDSVLDKKFRLDVIHAVKTDGSTRANIDKIKPSGAAVPIAKAKAAPAEEMDSVDPFEDE